MQAGLIELFSLWQRDPTFANWLLGELFEGVAGGSVPLGLRLRVFHKLRELCGGNNGTVVSPRS